MDRSLPLATEHFQATLWANTFSKLSIETMGEISGRYSVVFIDNFEQVLNIK